MHPAPLPDAAQLAQAADWAIACREGPLDAATQQQLDRWCQQSPAHAEAWRRARTVLGLFDQVPGDLARPALEALAGQRRQRRRKLGLLGLLALATPTAWLAWRSGVPGDTDAGLALATAVGQRQTHRLPDGSQLVLNTGSAVSVEFGPRLRRVRLQRGELLIRTRPDRLDPPRPFVVSTPVGEVQALGTHFSVRLLDSGQVRVGVHQHAVQVRPRSAPARRLQAGQRLDFAADGSGPVQPLDETALLWQQGMLLARDMRLAEVVAELARHRPAGLACAPEVAELRVSGALSLDRPDDGVALLLHTLPLRLDQAAVGPPMLRHR